MFEGLGFGEAVKRARKKIYEEFGHRTNTWGAFQCYGDPFYKLTKEGIGHGNEDDLLVCEEVEIELQNTFESMAANNYDHDVVLRRIDFVVDKMSKRKMLNDRIQELSAGIYASLQEYEKSCGCFESLLKSKKASYTINGFERYCNILAKLVLQKSAAKKIKLEEAVMTIDKVISDLEGIVGCFGPSTERWSLIGSAYKRKMHLLKESSIEEVKLALGQATNAYREASESSLFRDAYPLTNWLTLARIQCLMEGKESIQLIDLGARKAMQSIFDEINESTKKKDDFWSLSHYANIMLTQLLLGIEKYENGTIAKEYLKLWELAGNKGQKVAELEHLEIIGALLVNLKEGNSKELHDEISKIKKALEEAF
tara:strand:- start:249 stop:1355 length:1107 start_codon:yes stop_codon:yes gene_type:complete